MQGIGISETQDVFGAAADRLEALAAFCCEVADDMDDRVSPGLKKKAKLIQLIDR
jgi:hypothetical protein